MYSRGAWSRYGEARLRWRCLAGPRCCSNVRERPLSVLRLPCPPRACCVIAQLFAATAAEPKPTCVRHSWLTCAFVMHRNCVSATSARCIHGALTGYKRGKLLGGIGTTPRRSASHPDSEDLTRRTLPQQILFDVLTLQIPLSVCQS